MSAFKIGGSAVGSVCVGSKEIDKVYVGAQLVYQKHIPVTTWEYVFGIDASRFDAPAAGGSLTVNITSYKKKLVDGVETGDTETVGATVSYHSGADFATIDRSGLPTYVVISCPENTGDAREEVDVFSQDESGKTVLCTVSQERQPLNSPGTCYIELENKDPDIGWNTMTSEYYAFTKESYGYLLDIHGFTSGSYHTGVNGSGTDLDGIRLRFDESQRVIGIDYYDIELTNPLEVESFRPVTGEIGSDKFVNIFIDCTIGSCIYHWRLNGYKVHD